MHLGSEPLYFFSPDCWTKFTLVPGPMMFQQQEFKEFHLTLGESREAILAASVALMYPGLRMGFNLVLGIQCLPYS